VVVTSLANTLAATVFALQQFGVAGVLQVPILLGVAAGHGLTEQIPLFDEFVQRASVVTATSGAVSLIGSIQAVATDPEQLVILLFPTAQSDEALGVPDAPQGSTLDWQQCSNPPPTPVVGEKQSRPCAVVQPVAYLDPPGQDVSDEEAVQTQKSEADTENGSAHKVAPNTITKENTIRLHRIENLLVIYFRAFIAACISA